MPKWIVRKDTAQLRPWRVWQLDHRADTERGYDTWRSAFAYALLHADPAAEVLAA